LALEPKDRQHLEAILIELKAVIKEIEAASIKMETHYRTVGGELFRSPLMELKQKCQKAQSKLMSVL
jgi:chaperonin cofactor prefoldin